MPGSPADPPSSSGSGDHPFARGATGNIYSDSRSSGLIAVVSQYRPTFRPSRYSANRSRLCKITQIVGHATQGDTEYVANSGNHAAETSVYIEDQPDIDGFGGLFGTNGAYGTTHSITLIVDSLALQELFKRCHPHSNQHRLRPSLRRHRMTRLLDHSGIVWIG